MAPIVHSVEINRGPDEVFAYVTDPSRFTEWQAAVSSASAEGSGPLQQGSRLVMTRRMGPREQTMTAELTQYDSPRSYAFRGLDGPVRAIGKGSLEPLGKVTALASRWNSTSRATGSASCWYRWSYAGRPGRR